MLTSTTQRQSGLIERTWQREAKRRFKRSVCRPYKPADSSQGTAISGAGGNYGPAKIGEQKARQANQDIHRCPRTFSSSSICARCVSFVVSLKLANPLRRVKFRKNRDFAQSVDVRGIVS